MTITKYVAVALTSALIGAGTGYYLAKAAYKPIKLQVIPDVSDDGVKDILVTGHGTSTTFLNSPNGWISFDDFTSLVNQRVEKIINEGSSLETKTESPAPENK